MAEGYGFKGILFRYITYLVPRRSSRLRSRGRCARRGCRGARCSQADRDHGHGCDSRHDSLHESGYATCPSLDTWPLRFRCRVGKYYSLRTRRGDVVARAFGPWMTPQAKQSQIQLLRASTESLHDDSHCQSHCQPLPRTFSTSVSAQCPIAGLQHASGPLSDDGVLGTCECSTHYVDGMMVLL